MSTADFLLELRSEEIPARMQAAARNALARLFAQELGEAGLEAESIDTWSTPRRLALIARGLPLETKPRSEEIKGPRTSAPPQALDGFLRKTGLSREQLEDRGGMFFAVIDTAGQPTGELLGSMIARIVANFPWPKSMRWGAASASTESLRWVRPLHGIVAMLGEEIVPVTIAQKKGDALVVSLDEHPRETSLEALAKLKGVVRPDGSVTAGNASGVNDGACALLLANAEAADQYGLRRRARVVGMASAGVEPRVMGIGPAPATQKLLRQLGMTIDQFDVIALNEAFASQGLAVLRMLGVADDDPRVNPNGGAIALGHPLGASGARLVTTALHQLERTGGRFALCTMCIGVGQGIAIAIERV